MICLVWKVVVVLLLNIKINNSIAYHLRFFCDVHSEKVFRQAILLDQFVQRQTEDFINVTCEKDASQINDIFGDMEKSVHIMESYVLGLINSKADIEDAERQVRTNFISIYDSRNSRCSVLC